MAGGVCASGEHDPLVSVLVPRQRYSRTDPVQNLTHPLCSVGVLLSYRRTKRRLFTSNEPRSRFLRWQM